MILDRLADLKKLLEGKTVLRVEEPLAPECICKITLTDGTAFRLFATDLGFWMQETVAEGGPYKSLSMLFMDVNNFMYTQSTDGYETEVSVEGDTLKVLASGKTFEVSIPSLDEWGQKVCRHASRDQLIRSSCELGELYNIVFKEDNDLCPPELRLP